MRFSLVALQELQDSIPPRHSFGQVLTFLEIADADLRNDPIIGTELNLGGGMSTRAVDLFEKLGWVVRTSRDGDRRAKVLRLTVTGHEVIRHLAR